ncbi:porphobilinogen synthase [Sphingomicrobium sp. XHP0239]|uniref:porphobilinogen synthase n=1 Tax=Sphingomicrobium maritimum TaxID=3133972 RepID=UPI0031CC8D46
MSFPSTRMRRRRTAPWMRAMLREHRLHPSDLIWPLFVCEGSGEEQPVAALRGVSRWSVDGIVERAREAAAAGIPAVALFPNTADADRSEDAAEALNPDNLVCRAIRAIKDADIAIGVMTDVALDPYTSHGHDGIVDEAGRVRNDATVEILARQAVVQAEAGADIVAPSDMMDGRIGAIRDALEEAGHPDTAIMAYAAKYASALYGPFREAVGSGDRLKGDKRGYQMDPANGVEALDEVELDIDEGADFVMVKPGMLYLDVVARVVDAFETPVFAYMTSGEYAMIEEAAAAGAGNREAMLMEALTAFKRAGATGILTYHALEIARKIA